MSDRGEFHDRVMSAIKEIVGDCKTGGDLAVVCTSCLVATVETRFLCIDISTKQKERCATELADILAKYAAASNERN